MAKYLTYPFKTMGISQGYSGSYSHAKYSNGKPADYPVDEAGANTGRDWMYAPVDLKVMKVYGRGVRSQPNTVWLQSTQKVITPIGIYYVCGRATHMSDSDIKGLKVGKVFKAGSKMFREYVDGGATGNHIHMTWGTGKFKGSGWSKNNKGAYALTTTGSNKKPEQIFFLDKKFTTKTRMTQGLKFMVKPAAKTMYVNTPGSRLNVRASYSTSSKIVQKLKNNAKVTVYVTRGNWCLIGEAKWVHKKYLSTKK